MNQIDKLAQILWNYNHMHHQVKVVDCILVSCSHDLRVADRGVDLFLENFAPFIVFSGGLGRLTKGVFTKPEADLFAEIALKRKVPADKILIENQSTNTGENILFTKRLLQEKGLTPHSFILVQKPYMERRAYATFKKHLPNKEVIVTSPQLTFEEYCSEKISKDEVINIMVGDTQRIKLYAEKEFQIPQEMPDEVWDAFKQLVAKGYTKHVIL